jgi:replicative DNA helicase
VAIEELLHELMDELEERAERGGGLRGLASGFPDVDDITGGFRRGDLVVLAGRPSMGKTQLALNIASHAALAGEAGVLAFTFEMSREAAAQRMLAAAAHVDGERLDRGQLEPREWKSLLEACERTGDDARPKALGCPGLDPVAGGRE